MKRLLMIAILAALPAFCQEHKAAEGHGAAAEGHGESHESGSEVWKWANFGILAAMIVYFGAKSLPGFFKSRTAHIQKSILEAQKVREEAEAKAAEIDRKLANLGTEIDKMRSDAKREMDNEAARIQEETSRTLSRLEAHTAQEIDSLTKHAENELQAYAADLALKLAQTKVQERMTSQTQAALVDRFLKTAGNSGSRVN